MVLNNFTLALCPTIFCIFALSLRVESASSANGTKLFLTPLITSGKIVEAKEAALIHWNRDSLDGIPSYSGFLTVNDTANTNVFFWFVPAMVEDPDEAPVMLWLNGAGTSSMYGLFVENGPFKVKKRGRIPKLVLRVRKDTWARRHSMLYIDAPVGVGFSFTDDPQAYPRSLDDVTTNVYTALEQFFTMFPEFSKQKFYLAGEGYAAKYLPRLGLRIHDENLHENATKISLKGLIVGGPVTEPVANFTPYADYYYYLGLIDDKSRNYAREQETQIAKLFTDGNIAEAQNIQAALLFPSLALGESESSSYFTNQTGFNYFATALESRSHKKRYYYTQFLNLTSTRKLIHVGDQPFNNVSSLSAELQRDIYSWRNTKGDFEKLLNLKYKTLIYVGQMDLFTPHIAVGNFVKGLDFQGRTEFSLAVRKIIKDKKRKDVSGYSTSGGGLEYVVVRNAGQHAPSDEPRWCREIVEKFVNGDHSEK